MTRARAGRRVRAPAARAGAAGAGRGGAALPRLRRRRGCGAGGADRGGDAVAARGRARQSARLADPGRVAAHDRSRAQRDGAPPARGARASAWCRRTSRSRCAAGRGRRDASRTTRSILLFMCCHPALTPPSAIALTLRAVGGLTTAEIANAFLVPEATMAQRISRAKQTHQGLGRAVRDAGDGGARRAARRRAARALSDLQRGLHQPASGAELQRTRSLERGDPADARCCTGCCPTTARSRGCWR